jgi:hypothetical protein
MPPNRVILNREIDELVDAQRATCLWFLRADYYPGTDAERLRILDAIQRRGGLAAYRQAAQLKQWLSQSSSEKSVSS